MKNDNVTLDFQRFSEMLDNEETLESNGVGHDSDTGLLLELRRELRQTSAQATLPEGFAAATARAVQERQQAMSLPKRLLLRWEPVLRSSPFSKAAAPWLFAGGLLGLGVAVAALPLFFLLALVILSASPFLQLYYRKLPREVVFPELADPLGAKFYTPLFYMLPTVAALLTAGAAGQGLIALSEISLSFQTTRLFPIALAASLVVFVWLTNAFWPLWSALEKASRGTFFQTFVFQALHGLWLLAALRLVLGESLWSELSEMGLPLLAFLSGTLAITWTLGSRTAVEAAAPPLWPVVRRSFLGFLVGLVPLVLGLVVFYQASLTREIVSLPRYQQMQLTGQKWLAEVRAIPAQENGFVELAPLFLRRGSLSPEVEQTFGRLFSAKRLLSANRPKPGEGAPLEAREIETIRRNFLAELPRLEAALAKPKNSWYAVKPDILSRQPPDFSLGRDINQALQALQEESVARQDTAAALRYLETNLRWSKSWSEGVLIDLMIGVAMQRSALSPVERLLYESPLTKSELRQLLRLLDENRLPHDLFFLTMLRETYIMDANFARLESKDEQALGGLMGENNTAWLKLVPASYWRSERKAYANLQLSQRSDWSELRSGNSFEKETLVAMLPWNFSVRELYPNSGRAQDQFLMYLSFLDAQRLQVALELYRQDHGLFPERLQQLVPSYLEAVPVDATHPNRWARKGTFDYQRSGGSYHLVSRSPMWAAQNKPEQRYGPLAGWRHRQ